MEEVLFVLVEQPTAPRLVVETVAVADAGHRSGFGYVVARIHHYNSPPAAAPVADVQSVYQLKDQTLQVASSVFLTFAQEAAD